MVVAQDLLKEDAARMHKAVATQSQNDAEGPGKSSGAACAGAE